MATKAIFLQSCTAPTWPTTAPFLVALDSIFSRRDFQLDLGAEERQSGVGPAILCLSAPLLRKAGLLPLEK